MVGSKKTANFVMDWETRYQNNDTPWDKGTAHPMVAELASLTLPVGPIVVPGCGSGSDLLELAAIHPGRKILGLDIAPSAVAAARARTQHVAEIEIHAGDFLQDDLAARFGPAALLWEHTCFCAIPPEARPAYASAAARVLGPEGWLAGVFFIELADGGAGPPWNCPEPEWRAHFHSDFEIQTAAPVTRTYPGREGAEWGVVLRRKR